MTTPEQIEAIIKALENPAYMWRTIIGVATEAKLPREVVVAVIDDSPEWLVQASVPSRTGQSLFTTRQHFREHASTADKLIGALKNRLR